MSSERSVPQSDVADPEPDLAAARRVLETEVAGLRDLARRLDTSFILALDLLAAVRGRVVVTGMGKSGHVARKIAATLASTGTPALFVHPAEASHGDLGMIKKRRTTPSLPFPTPGETTGAGRHRQLRQSGGRDSPSIAITSARRTAPWPKRQASPT